MVTESTLVQLESLMAACDPGPWTPRVEGRDGLSFDSFIQTGPVESCGEDLYLTRDTGPAPAQYLDLIALMRNTLPALITEVRESQHR
jgi:hypothetical protein